MGIKKTTSLKMAFWKFLIMLLCGLTASVLLPFGILLLSAAFGAASYADYSERSVQSIAPIIAATPDLSEIQLPAGCKYLLLDKNYRMVETTLEGRDLKRAMNYATTGTMNQHWNKQYLLVSRENEYVILQYFIGSQFTNEWMNDHLPSPELLLYLAIGLNCICVCIILTTRFARKLRSELSPLFDATKEVAKQNLDFEVGHSKIKEFDEVLLSFSNMKDNLRNALKQQWKAEQLQKEQIGALAHDLKTPLTIIQGNADLLCETDLSGEQRLYTDYITDSSQQMQIYIKALIDISRAANAYPLHNESIRFPDYLKQIEPQMDALCHTKNIRLQIRLAHLPKQLTIDKLLLERAIMNVVNNALDFSPQNGTIYISGTTLDNYVQLTITDAGCGFSPEALLHAKEQFYMADKSRSRETHFGMGLYITNSILEQLNGRLLLENSNETGGAKVTLLLPLIQ